VATETTRGAETVRARRLAGWPLVGWAALAGGLTVALALASGRDFDDGLHRGLRWTARLAGVLFCAAFSASALRRLWRSQATHWLLANRRYLGVSFASVMAWHLSVIAAHAPRAEEPAGPSALVGGGLAYLLAFAMAATSSDRAFAWLGRSRWRRLHLVGGWWNWFVFAFTFAGASAAHATSIPFALLAFATGGLRLAAWRQRRRGAPVGH
jgi:hypothetical protein